MSISPTKSDQDAVNCRAGTAYGVPSGAQCAFNSCAGGHCGLSPDRKPRLQESSAWACVPPKAMKRRDSRAGTAYSVPSGAQCAFNSCASGHRGLSPDRQPRLQRSGCYFHHLWLAAGQFALASNCGDARRSRSTTGTERTCGVIGEGNRAGAGAENARADQAGRTIAEVGEARSELRRQTAKGAADRRYEP